MKCLNILRTLVSKNAKFFNKRIECEHFVKYKNISMKEVVTLITENGIENHSKPCGFHLSKSEWDPYPWVGSVEDGSIADVAGLRTGDCLLGVNGVDILDTSIQNIAALIRGTESECKIELCLWRSDKKCNQNENGVALKGPITEVAKNLATTVSQMVRILECPICLESSNSPISQCVNGHIICFLCRQKTLRCPVCRVRLGQGRCLFADEINKILRDNFDVKINDSELEVTRRENLNLRERLFGRKDDKKRETHRKICTKPRRLLLTKLFFGGIEKAASMETLTVPKALNENQQHFYQQLNINDRKRSVSTSELSMENHNPHDNDHLSVPDTPVWGGSTDSMSNSQITCPLAKRLGCKETFTPDMLIDHVSRTHSSPIIHFYGGTAKIPYPLPFDATAIYLLDHSGETFIYQHEDDGVAWIGRMKNNNRNWEWTLHGIGLNTEIKLHKSVTSLENPMVLLPQHVAPLPNALSLEMIYIQIKEVQSSLTLDV